MSEQSMLDKLTALTYVQLVSVLKYASPNGRIGYDTARNPATKTKTALIHHLVNSMPALAVSAAYARVARSIMGYAEEPLSVDTTGIYGEPAPMMDPPPVIPPPAHGGLFGEPAAPKAVPAPVAAPVAPGAAADLSAAITAIMQQVLAANPQQPAMSADEIRELVLKTVADAVPTPLHIIAPTHEVTLTGVYHHLLPKVIKLLTAGLNVLLVGPAGCGKTQLARQAAEALQVGFHRVPYTAGAAESWILGRYMPTGDGGKFEFHRSKVEEHYTEGGLTLHDEIDAADSNMALILNGLADGGGFSNPLTNEYLRPHERSYMIAAANTFGMGADIKFVGRNQLDAATLSRWYVLEMDYDATIEKAISSPFWFEKISELRKRARHAKLNREISTRMMIQATRAEAAGLDRGEIMSDLVSGWSQDELNACGLN